MAAATALIGHCQSSLLVLSKPSFLSPPRSSFVSRSTVTAVHIHPSFPLHRRSNRRPVTVTAVAGQEAAPLPIAADPSPEDIELEVEIGGGEGGGEGFGGEGGGGGGDKGEESEGGSDKDKKEKTSGMSMSQKLTLGYAALVGVGGVMGYMKSGSHKSLAAGGISSVLLYYVYTQLPTRPAFASSIGLGLSAALLAVMGSRFKKSRKVFPAGVVSLVSLVMVGGYFHGILRSLHA